VVTDWEALQVRTYTFVEMELDSQITGAVTTATLEIEHSFTLQTGYKIKMVVSGDMGFSTTSTTSNCVSGKLSP